MLTYFFFLLGFVLLIKGADLLVDGASAISRKFNVSDLVIGLTVVAFGTSTPELFVNIVASARGNTEIAIGNVLGSNISNVFLILGISSIIYPLSVSKGTVWKEIPSNRCRFRLRAIWISEWSSYQACFCFCSCLPVQNVPWTDGKGLCLCFYMADISPS